ncbi:MAG TPA: gamma-glutamylcyclotransferase family protein [Vicinamibacterales bacterium]|jgi:gamma-glutamylcyclotransferase (GGCT)/AIG2-like uncharacterized protein YtfP
MTDLVFFYGTLMQGFSRPGRTSLEANLHMIGRGAIQAALFDVGIYPAAVPTADGRVWGEAYRMSDPDGVLRALDGIEGYRPDDPDTSLYTRIEMPVTLEDGRLETAWVYVYNAPLGRAPRIESGDYLEYLRVR